MINQLEAQELDPMPYDQFQRWMPELPPSYIQMFGGPVEGDSTMFQLKPKKIDTAPLRMVEDRPRISYPENFEKVLDKEMNSLDLKKAFALTPLDAGYFEDNSPKASKLS